VCCLMPPAPAASLEESSTSTYCSGAMPRRGAAAAAAAGATAAAQPSCTWRSEVCPVTPTVPIPEPVNQTTACVTSQVCRTPCRYTCWGRYVAGRANARGGCH
jgi:hypothetical protein